MHQENRFSMVSKCQSVWRPPLGWILFWCRSIGWGLRYLSLQHSPRLWQSPETHYQVSSNLLICRHTRQNKMNQVVFSAEFHWYFNRDMWQTWHFLGCSKFDEAHFNVHWPISELVLSCLGCFFLLVLFSIRLANTNTIITFMLIECYCRMWKGRRLLRASVQQDRRNVTSPKAPRPITLRISKSSLCSRICFTLDVKGFALRGEKRTEVKTSCHFISFDSRVQQKPQVQSCNRRCAIHWLCGYCIRVYTAASHPEMTCLTSVPAFHATALLIFPGWLCRIYIKIQKSLLCGRCFISPTCVILFILVAQ